MTRREAAEKVAKLMRLARDNPSLHESTAARSRARKIVEEHSLTLEELSAGKKARAFDDLVTALRKNLSDNPEPHARLLDAAGIVEGILSKLEKMSDSDKSRRLEEASKLIETAVIFNDTLGKIGLGSRVVTTIKTVFDDTLAAHDLTRT